jgi:outer membrane protein assembly factor BamE
MADLSRTLILCAAAVFATACSGLSWLTPYRIDVRQGNMVDQQMVSQLRPGMTKDQVRFVLGTPMLTDMFHADRWDYVYRFQPGHGEAQQRVITVFFDAGKLVRVAGDVVAAGARDQSGAPEAAR